MIPTDRYYTANHLWVKIEDSTATVGITDHAQRELGDVIFVELPPPEKEMTKDAECIVVESIKAASEIQAPLSGRIVETNALLDTKPELINKDPYSQGWLVKLWLTDGEDLNTLLDADAYGSLLEDN
ncbi:glycine cleavage system protein GcvH [Verrucomicrobiota bacterium]